MTGRCEAISAANKVRWANPENRAKLSQRMKGSNNPFWRHKHSEESIRKSVESNRINGTRPISSEERSNWWTPEKRLRQSNIMKNSEMLKAQRESHSEFMKNHNPMKNPETQRKVSETWTIEKRKYYSENNPSKRPEVREKMSKGNKSYWEQHPEKKEEMRTGNPMHRKEVIKTWKSNLYKRNPTKPELQLLEIINKYKLPYNYTGNSRRFVGNRRPDFMHENIPKIIEFDGPLHFLTLEQEKDTNRRNEIYHKHGYQVLCLTYDNMLDEEKLVNKIIEYTGGC